MSYRYSSIETRFRIGADSVEPARCALEKHYATTSPKLSPLVYADGKLSLGLTCKKLTGFVMTFEVPSGAVSNIVLEESYSPSAAGAFFEVIARYVDIGSYIVCKGEDGDIWKWCFERDGMVEKKARMVFE